VSDENTSLIDPPARQLMLPGVPTEEAWQATECAEGSYTGERLFLRHPQVYNAVVELLAASVPIRTIARLLRVHTKTVMGVREREPSAIATAKQHLSDRLLALGELQAEIARDQLARMLESGEELTMRDLKDLLIGLGITLDKGLLTGGHATARVEHITPEPTHDDFNRLVKDVTGEIGLSGGTPGQKAVGPGPGALDGRDPGGPGPEQRALPGPGETTGNEEDTDA